MRNTTKIFGVFGLSFAFSSVAVAVTPISRSAPRGQNTTILEVAPLRGLIGQPAVRGEVMMQGKWAFAANYESWDGNSQRDDFTDHHVAFAAEGMMYPLGLAAYPAFVGCGLKVEQADLGRQQERSSITWARTNADERFDRWVNHDTYYSLVESVGYRLITGTMFTASLRLVRDQLLQSSGSVERDGILSSDPDVSTSGRPAVRNQLLLHAGVLLE